MRRGIGKSYLVPRFLRERYMRTVLQNLYVATVGSSNNAKMLLDHEPAEIGVSMVAGSPLVRECFIAAKRWLLLAQEFASSYETFLNQILEPARCPGRFLLNIREISPSTTQLKGLVISKSRPFFDKYFEDRISSVTIIVPEVEAVMNLRCRFSVAENIKHKFYSAKKVQPIPFVNRIHPISNQELDLKPTEDKPSLSVLDFLKISFSDVPKMRGSMSLENFCEIWSEQGKRRILGFPFIISGLVVSVGFGPNITLQSLCNPELQISLHVTEHLLNLLNTDLYGLVNLRGKPVRVLAVDWYRYGPSRILPRYPEILALENVDEYELLLDDFIGFVRLREKVELGLLKKRYPLIDFQSLPKCIFLENELASYSHATKGGDAIISAFIEEKNRLRTLRNKHLGNSLISSTLIPMGFLFNIENLRLAAISERVKRDEYLLHTLLCLIHEHDHRGHLKGTTRELARAITGIAPEIFIEKLSWLKGIGFILKTKEIAKITRNGFVIAYLAIKQDLMKIIRQKREPLLSILNLKENTSLPTTLILQAMYDLEKEGYVKPLVTSGHRCELFWIVCSRNGKDSEIQALTLLQGMEREVIEILGEVHHPLSEHKILEIIKKKGINLDLVTLNMMLLELKAKNKIKKHNDNWIYPWEGRILDLFHVNPYRTFTIDEILSKTSIPPVSRDIVYGILNDFCMKGKITKILGDKWTIYPPDKEAILKCECKSTILKTLIKRGGRMPLEKMKTDKNLLVSIMNINKSLGSVKSSFGFGIGSQELLQLMLEEMKTEKKIVMRNGFVEVVADR